MDKLKKNKDILIISAIISTIILIITIIQLKATRFAYYWDYVGYYENCVSLIEHLSRSFIIGIKKIIYTIFYSDYNYFAAILPTIIMGIFGKSRITYTIGITIFYYIPFIFLFLFALKPMLKELKYKNIYYVAATLTCLPLLMYLNYMGYVDIGGLNIILILFLMARKKEYRILPNILLGCTAMILFFFRRWYVFYIVSFLITLFGFDFYDFIKTKSEDKKDMFLKYFQKYMAIGITMLVIVGITLLLNIILFTHDETFKLEWGNFYLTKLLFTDYGDLYSAYNRPLSSDLMALGNKFGYMIIALAVFSIVMSIKNKKNIKSLMFLFVQTILCFILFENTQSHDIHHFLLYVVNLMLIVSFIFVNSEKKTTKIIVTAMLVINTILTLPITYNNTFVKVIKQVGIVNNIDLRPLKRNDLDEFEKVNNEITRLSNNGNNKIYINASSSVINDSMIYSYDKIMGTNFSNKNFLLSVAHVDSRDGIPESIKDADIIIVTDKDQIHMNPINQKVISYINKVFLDSNYTNELTDNFEQIKTMNIGEVQLYFFGKIKNISDDEYNIFVEGAKQYLENGI